MAYGIPADIAFISNLGHYTLIRHSKETLIKIPLCYKDLQIKKELQIITK